MGMQQKNGFTMVEFMIAIVVIAIIATISIVSYSGLRARSENAKTIQGVKAYANALDSYAVFNRSYPVTTVFPCLGSASTCSRVVGATNCFGAGGASSNSTFNAAVSTIVSVLPEVSNQQISCGGNLYSGAYYNKNDTGAGKTAQLVYYLKGNVACDQISNGTITRSQQDDLTRCILTLQSL